MKNSELPSRHKKPINTPIIEKPVRPLAVTIVVIMFSLVLCTVAGNLVALLIEQGIILLPGVTSEPLKLQSDLELFFVLRIGITLAVLITGIAACIGLYMLKHWAWTVAMFLLGFSLAIEISAYFLDQSPSYLVMLANVTQVLLLDQEPVRQLFIPKEVAA